MACSVVNSISFSFQFKIIYPGYKFSINTVLQLTLQNNTYKIEKLYTKIFKIKRSEYGLIRDIYIYIKGLFFFEFGPEGID